MLKIFWLVGALIFAYAVAMQYNDPDPLVWMSLYGIVALANVGALLDKLPPRAVAIATVPHFLYCLWLSPHLLRTSAAAFETIGMRNDLDELVREAWGTVICVAWMAILYVHARRSTAGKRVEAHA